MGHQSPESWRRGLSGPVLKPEIKHHPNPYWGSWGATGQLLLLRMPEVPSDDDGVLAALLLLESANRIQNRKQIPSPHSSMQDSCLYFPLVERIPEAWGKNLWKWNMQIPGPSELSREQQAYLLSGTLSGWKRSRRSSILLFQYVSFLLWEMKSVWCLFILIWIGLFPQVSESPPGGVRGQF